MVISILVATNMTLLPWNTGMYAVHAVFQLYTMKCVIGASIIMATDQFLGVARCEWHSGASSLSGALKGV